MATILCIETSTEICSVALTQNGNVIDYREDHSGLNHAKLVTVFINDLLTANHLKATNLNAVAVSKGPGSYTGLRIGVSVAKGICYATSIPLIAVCPLQAMARNAIKQVPQNSSHGEKHSLIPMIDARRMEVYTAIFDLQMNTVREVSAMIINPETFNAFSGTEHLWLFGNGAGKCRDILKGSNIHFIDGIIASARNMAPLAIDQYNNQAFPDLAYFEPFYLKDFIATIPKNSVLKNRSI